MSALLEVPDEHKLTLRVIEFWERIHKEVARGDFYPTHLTLIETAIAQRQAHLKNGELDQQYDWQDDLDAAILRHRIETDFHAKNLDWNKRVADQWSRYGDEAQSYIVRLQETAIKTLFFMHGAVGLAAFAALATPSLADQVWLAAIIAIVGALTGLILVSIGIIIITRTLPHMTAHVRSRAWEGASRRTWSALARLHDIKIKPQTERAEHFILGSFVLFITYALAALVALMGCCQ